MVQGRGAGRAGTAEERDRPRPVGAEAGRVEVGRRQPGALEDRLSRHRIRPAGRRERGVRQGQRARRVQQGDRGVQQVERAERALPLGALAIELPAQAADADQPERQAGEAVEQGSVLGRKALARFRRDGADRADGVAVRQTDRSARVEPDERRAGDQRVVVKALVAPRVRHHQDLGLQDGVPAERDVAPGLGGREASVGLEPLAFRGHQRHQADRHVEQPATQRDDGVEIRVGAAVEQVQGVEGVELEAFVDRQRGGRHGRPPQRAGARSNTACTRHTRR